MEYMKFVVIIIINDSKLYWAEKRTILIEENKTKNEPKTKNIYKMIAVMKTKNNQ